MEGRRQPRLDSRIPVEAHPGKADMSAAALELTRNLSTGGLCFQTREELETGRLYELSIHLPVEEAGDPAPVTCLVRIAWREAAPEGQLVGAEFVRVSLADHRKIYRYLDSF